MKRTVTITLEVDASEFEDVEDTAEGTVELIYMALTGEADIVNDMKIACEDVVRVYPANGS